MRDTITLHLEMFCKERGSDPVTIMRVAIDNDWGEYKENYRKKDPPIILTANGVPDTVYMYELERWRQREQRRKEYIDAISKQLACALYDRY